MLCPIGAALSGALALALVAGPSVQWSADVRTGPGPKGAVALHTGVILCARSEGIPDGVRVTCAASSDGGRTWSDLGEIVRAGAGADIGDGCLFEASRGMVLYSYRDNRTPASGEPTYAIRIAESTDGGRAWRAHSTVTECKGARGGLWSSFLFRSRDGALHCVYDDERTPWDAGFARHQWLTMRTWDPARSAWERPVTVTRAHDPAHLSRDGMASIVALDGDRLLCVFETVDTAPPHAGVIMAVTSDDGGKTWSWSKRERSVVYRPADRRYGAYGPWMVRVSGGAIVCLFGRNEGRAAPIPGGTPLPALGLDMVATVSGDGGQTWSKPAVVYEGSHRNALSGLIVAPGKPDVVLAHWLDFDRGYLMTEGRVIK
ncbi:MAG: exo-alpha-sialidase [Armatimonadetes bacterium]|nr:exo-alpha-sialidase [Armatimonadota bacterium]